ncbi:MAG: aminoglycoside 3'-phosphotransferase [Clostridia bacterium]|nr:aminoglycoside 3'-phosphotransferase [Clostridia bacterium]
MNREINELPESILKTVRHKPYEVTRVGLSGAEVRVYENFVLKIQPHSATSVNEAAFMRFLQGKIPVPEVVLFQTQNGMDYLLMTRLRGRMLCSEEYLSNPKTLFEKAAKVLHMLWAIPAKDCPSDMSLSYKLRLAENNVVGNLVDVGNVNPSTFGAHGRFKNPEHLLRWLIDNKPAEDIVTSHGDLCLPNIFDCGGETAIIDFPYGGAADRYCDIALLYRSSKDNLQGGYGKFYSKFDEKLFFDVLSVTPDRDKIDYYILLDELF